MYTHRVGTQEHCNDEIFFFLIRILLFR